MVLADTVYDEQHGFVSALDQRGLPSVIAIRSTHGIGMDARERIRTTLWRAFERIFSDGSSQERYLQETICGRRRGVRSCQITTDPVRRPPESTWQLMTNLPGKIEHAVGNTFGLRTWIEYGFKQAKDELGWADVRLTDAASTDAAGSERGWELVLCAYRFVSLQAPLFAAPQADSTPDSSPFHRHRAHLPPWPASILPGLRMPAGNSGSTTCACSHSPLFVPVSCSPGCGGIHCRILLLAWQISAPS